MDIYRTIMDHYGPLWTIMDHYGPLCFEDIMPSSPLSLGYNQAIDKKFLDIPGSGGFHNTKVFCDPSGGNSAVFNNFGKYHLLSFIQLCSN